MPDLVAVDIPGGPAFVRAVKEIWSRGDAFAPLDQRLPPEAAQRHIESLRPAYILDGSGDKVALSGGVPVEEGDALIITTSGSTGFPKSVVLTMSSVESSAWAASDALGVEPATDKWLACLPLAHIGGLSVVTRAIITETPVEVHSRFDAASVETAARSGATLVSLVPTAARRIGPSSFRKILVGGAAPGGDLPENSVITYGMTETGSGIVYDGFPLNGVEIMLRPSKQTVSQAVGETAGPEASTGEILVRGPMTMRCYRDGSDPKLPGGWLPTGDFGGLAADGRLTVDGRIAEVIVTGGEKVWPASVEASIKRMASVEEAVVTGLPDEEWGQRVVAVVELCANTDIPELIEVREQVKAQLPSWSAPKQLIVVDAVPRLPSGKVDRKAVSKIAAARLLA